MPSFSETIPSGDRQMEVYSSVPSGSGPFPAILVIHHGTGVDQFVRDIADRFPADGYVAVAPDLFHRVTPDMTADGTLPSRYFSDPEIIPDVNATVDFLRKQPAVNMERLGITGFCIGGRITWLLAATTSHFKAALPYHGGNIMVTWGKATQTPFELSSGISCPILFHFGEIDKNPSQEDMAKLDAELTRLGKPHQFFTYPGADHAFSDPAGTQYNEAAAAASWPRTLEFFAAHLKGVAVA